MKKVFYLLWTILTLACQSNNKANDENDQQAPFTQDPTNELFHLASERHEIFKEKLFFQLRQDYLNANPDYTLIKKEDLQVNHQDNSFIYLVVICDILGDSDGKGDPIYYEGSEQTLIITGNFKFDNLEPEFNQYEEVKVFFTFEIDRQQELNSPYDDTEIDQQLDNFEGYIAMDLQSHYNYGKDEMYLEARINPLQKAALASYSADELAYLRNEIFARHGHTFKTEAMKTYFANHNWYKAVINDVTEYLNETEKANIQLIKSMEAQVS